MANVFVSLGSNIDPAANLLQATRRLREHSQQLTASAVYRSKAVGFDGPDFLNAVIFFLTDSDVSSVSSLLTSLEDEQVRDRSQPRFSSRTLDLDLLLYDDLVCNTDKVQIPHAEILQQAYVLQPLAELAGDYCHPLTGLTLARHWLDMAHSRSGPGLEKTDIAL